MPNLQRFHEAMAKIMPIILQVEMEKQRQKLYLENQLKEYTAYGETQKKLKEQELANSIIQEIARTGGGWAKGQPFSASALVESLRGILTPELMGSLPIAQQPQPALGLAEAARAALVRILSAQAKRVAPDPADLQTVAEGFGSEIPGNVVSDVTQRKSEEESRALGYAGLEVQKLTGGIRAGELGLRREIAGKKVDEMNAAELRTLITTYVGQQKQIQARASDLYTPEAEQPVLAQQLQDIGGKLSLATNVLEQKILAQKGKTDKDYTELVDELKSRGITREQVVNSGELRRQLLIQGYAVTKVLDRWK
jgi:hypothetical protein